MNDDFDKLYDENPKIYGDEPSDWIVKILKYQKVPAVILDFGIGYGRNALFLAKQGFQVEGVDISKVAINQCLNEAEKNNLNIKCYNQNLCNFKFTKKYDVIFSTATLHYLDNEEEIFKVIENMKSNTKVGGLNIISAPTNTKIGMDFPYYFEKEKLYDFYRNWEIIEFDEEDDLFSTGKIGTIAFIIARKKN